MGEESQPGLSERKIRSFLPVKQDPREGKCEMTFTRKNARKHERTSSPLMEKLTELMSQLLDIKQERLCCEVDNVLQL